MADTISIEHNGSKMVVTGGYFGDLLKAVKGSFKSQRAWFRADDKTWVMPTEVPFDYIQKRIEKKGFQVMASAEEARRAELLAKREADRQARLEREAKWERERQERAAEREARKAAQARAIAERVRVKVGQYQIGDMLNGKEITGFGKSWTITEPGTWGTRGQRYDEACDCCGRVSIVDNDTGLCERCGADGETTRVCYAYFS